MKSEKEEIIEFLALLAQLSEQDKIAIASFIKQLAQSQKGA